MSDSHADVLLLLAARLRSRASDSSIGETLSLLGGNPAHAASGLAAALELGQVRCRGAEQRWSLTPAGSAELAGWLAHDADRAGRAELGTAYEAFLPMNRAFLAALAGEPEFEAIRSLVAELEPVLDALVRARSRFASYAPRFTAALVAAPEDHAWIASPSRDSVHTIWFELHEHLLATLGRDRSDER